MFSVRSFSGDAPRTGALLSRTRMLPAIVELLRPASMAFNVNGCVPNCDGPEALAAAVGVAPVTDQSGKMRKIYRRMRCDTFTRQSFVEWVKESWKHSVWAEAFYRQRDAKGHAFHAIMRALAYKWIRILWRCWTDGVPYDEETYLEKLRAKGSPLVPPKLDLKTA